MWGLLEKHKKPAPLLWSWFEAVKLKRKPLAYEDRLVKPSSYFYEPLQLPPEDLGPLPEKTGESPAGLPGSSGSRPRAKGVMRPRTEISIQIQ